HATLWPAIGNHDVRSADPATQSGVYFDLFNLPTQGQCGGVMSGTEAYYSFDYANAHFICLDSEDGGSKAGQAMLTWLKRDLEANTQLWTIAFWHHPPYSKGTHDSDLEPPMQQMRELALPLLEAAGVDLVLAGHSHNYERSYLIDGHYGASGTFSETMIKGRRNGKPDKTGPYLKPTRAACPHSGTVYVVAGSSGQTGQLKPTVHPAMCVSLKAAGSVVLDISGSHLDASFLDEKGQVRDQFTMRKDALLSRALQPGHENTL
ncbi:MAG TPA: metallophosphoesterase, partial [Clostridia bacterium]|nr:metallophosphoesterase [Clostridia bacterium]